MDFKSIMSSLAIRRPLFHSEADFQQSLAWTIHELRPKEKVRLEYPIRLLTGEPKENGSLDIWLEASREAIELKYNTYKWISTVNDEKYHLKYHMSHTSRYSFIRDLHRLEELARNPFVRSGYAILLTNKEDLWSDEKPPTDASKEFRLDGELSGLLRWAPDENKNIQLLGEYFCKWEDYSSLQGTSFKYLVIKV